MEKKLVICMVMTISVLIVGCSNQPGESGSTDQADQSTEEAIENNESFTAADDSVTDNERENSGNKDNNASSPSDKAADTDRKVIYKADLHIEVTNYEEMTADIRKQVNDRGGYIVESSMHDNSTDGSVNGQIKARIPQKHFREFVQLVEDGGKKVVNSSISGQDVTEEYVDLESRLESKKVVEKRLLSFMEDAEKTEDLLNVSEDLANVQEEIEQITGRMKYLQNKVDLATVTIQMEETNVTLTSDKDLNTWEKTKQQLMKSVNFLLSAFSGLFVFVVGNLPVLILLGAIGVVVFWIIRKRSRSRREE
ncbi:DUF4349 domain-containing protein [Lentibacillus halophilus]|uniref:DUF4349 domain-containing protein n=1 Tax=Lentibacillus halophilus TaxID=295065 RepID=A0ABN0Z9C7_9BACI